MCNVAPERGDGLDAQRRIRQYRENVSGYDRWYATRERESRRKRLGWKAARIEGPGSNRRLQTERDFFYEVVDAQISFVAGEEGKVTGLVLRQNGRDMPAKKIE